MAVYAHVEGIAEALAELRWQAYAPVTTCVTAALALASRALPGWHWGVNSVGEAHLYETALSGPRYVTSAPTPALAMCLAILRAKEPQPDGENT